MAQGDRADDPAFSPYPEDCDHPEAAQEDHSSGDDTCRPSFYCTNCNRLIFHGER
jgi:hypothetical protein